MNRRLIVTAMIMMFLAAGAFSFNSCSKKEQKKKETAAEKTPKIRKDRDEIISVVKGKYICPNLNMSLADSEKRGALCPEGAKILELVDKMIEGNMKAEDIYYLVENYKIQGEPIVKENGQAACDSLDGKLQLDFFIMSYCPFGVRFVDAALRPIIADIGGSVNWKPYYILAVGQSGKIESMHGQQEVDEDLRQICIREKWGAQKWLAYMGCFSAEIYAKAKTGNAKDWKYCATQAGIIPAELQTCFVKEATGFAQKDMQMARMYGASGSPTAVYNCNKNIVGAMPYEMIKTHLCGMFAKGKMPANCGI